LILICFELNALMRDDMLKHAQYILGVEIVFMLENMDEMDNMHMFDIPKIQPGKRTSSKQTKTFPAMLMPRDAELYALYRDVNDGIFVRAPCHHSIFILQQHWGQIANVLPKDSICRVIAYRNKNGELMLGVYDLLRLCGVDQEQCSVFERQKVLYSLFSKQSAGPAIVSHWVGEEGCLLEHMKTKTFVETLPFAIDNMLCIDAESGSKDVYKVVLRPLLIS
jgi:hypothetical protein